jgi:hypothetical protein
MNVKFEALLELVGREMEKYAFSYILFIKKNIWCKEKKNLGLSHLPYQVQKESHQCCL